MGDFDIRCEKLTSGRISGLGLDSSVSVKQITAGQSSNTASGRTNASLYRGQCACPDICVDSNHGVVETSTSQNCCNGLLVPQGEVAERLECESQ